jgi:hypothetical protein
MKFDETLPYEHEVPEDRRTESSVPEYVRIDEVRPEDYDGTCLRPLGLCELGGCCDACWYRPDHPRFQNDL